MQARKMFRTGLLVFGFSLWALLSLGCGGVQVSPVSISVASATINWSPDGSQIVFSRYEQGTFVVDVEGTHLHTIPPNAPIGEEWEPGSVSAALSPDGSRIAYVKVFNDGFLGRFQAEIMSARVDGTDVRRLTRSRRNDFDETSPSWSPDGRRIAFGTSASGGGDSLAIMNADGSNVLILTQRLPYFFLDDAPVWSPDGDWIGFLARLPDEENYSIQHLAIYMVRSDGTEVLDLGEAASPPAWSPDGSRIAFFQKQDEEFALYVANVDGTEKRMLSALGQYHEWYIASLSWSPDGSEILFTAYNRDNNSGIGHTVSVENGSILADFAGIVAAWSPDGSRIAVQTRICEGGYLSDCVPEFTQDVLYTIARDGTDRQVLVRGSGMRLAAEAEFRDISRSVAACGEGYVVPWPENNPGLVKDCETLLGLRDQLAGDVLLNWNLLVPIGEWEGVRIRGNPSRRGDPSRVRGLGLTGNPMYDDSLPAPLNGILPPGLGQLSALESLDLRDNSLTGSIPTELGNLSQLRNLVLFRNSLTGSIPAELGNLSQLEYLHLGENSLTGSIPAELGNLGKLGNLYLFKNNLTGSIPPELGNLANLRDLYLYDNNLSGCMPVGLSSLDDIRTDGLEYCE